MLDGPRDPERDVEGGSDDLAGLADLTGIRDPPGVDRGTGRPDDAAERVGKLADDPEPIGPTDAA